MANSGKTVIVSALSGTFQRKPFANVSELLALAEDVLHLNAVCSFCGNLAPYSLRTTDEEEVIVVGGSEKYVAACRSCYQAKSLKP
jgi:thymidine kinase